MLVVTVVVTAVACALGALIAGRAGLAAIPSGSQCGAVIGFALIIAGSLLDHHAHLTEWEIALLAAVLAGEDHRGFAFGAGGRTEYPATGILSTGDCRDPNRPERRFTLRLSSRSVTDYDPEPPPGGCGGQAAEIPGPGGLPGGTCDVSGDDIGRVAVQAAAGAVIPHRRPRIRVRGGLLHVSQRHPASKLAVMNACRSV